MELPAGTVTFWMTDIEGSTRLLQELGPSYADLLAGHHALIRAAVAAGGGTEVDTEGDAFFCVFDSVRGAVEAAARAQRDLAAHEWPGGRAVRVRMGLHTGEGRLGSTGYVGLDVHRTARVAAAAHGGQVVVTATTLVYSLAKAGRRDPVEVWGPAAEYRPLGTRAFTEHLEAAHAWDMESLCGHPGQSGARTITTEVPYDAPATVYERNGVRISSFPVIHILNGAVGYRLDYAGRSFVFSGDTRPCRPLVDACDGADLLIHETFPSAGVFAKKAGVPEAFAEMVVTGSHTSPAMAGKVFSRAGARMSVMWHFVVDHDTVGPAYAEMRGQYDGPVTIAQDLTTFTITKDAVVARQAAIDPVAWPVIGPTRESGPAMAQPHVPPAWWTDALITD